MAEITAKMVADLRAATGLGMMECKKALVETEGDVKAAEELLSNPVIEDVVNVSVLED